MRLSMRSVIISAFLISGLTGCNIPSNQAFPVSPIPENPKIAPTSSPAPLAKITNTPTPAPMTTELDALLPEGPLTMVALGDSLTQGDGDESGLNGFPNRLLQLVEKDRPGSQIINLGKSGWTSADLLNGVNGEAATLPMALAAKPNIALLWIGSNDLWYLYEYGPDPMTTEAEQQDLDNYKANLDNILVQLKKSGATTFIAMLDDQSKRAVVANPPNPSEPAFSATSPADLALMSAHVEALNAIIKEKAAQYDAITVDLYHTDIFTNPATISSDGNHPNTAGYEKITQIWFSIIQPYISQTK